MQIKWFLSLSLLQPPSFGLSGLDWHIAEGYDGNPKRGCLRNHLNGPPGDGCERGPQHFVTSYDFVYALCECSCVEPPPETQRYRDVVERTTRFQLVVKPQALLCE